MSVKVETQNRGAAVVAPLVLVVVAFAGCSPASSEPVSTTSSGEWALLTDDEFARVEVERKSLVREGENVRARMKLTPHKPSATPTNLPFAYTIESRAIDCSTGALDIQALSYYGSHGSLVEQAKLNLELGPFQEPPGTKGAHFTTATCELAGLPAPVLPMVSLLGVAPSDWRQVGTDVDDATVSVLASSAETKDGGAWIVTRRVYPSSRGLSGGRRYRHVVNTMVFACSERIHGVSTSDYYDDSGALVLAKEHDAEKRPARTRPDTLPGLIGRIACAAPPAKS